MGEKRDHIEKIFSRDLFEILDTKIERKHTIDCESCDYDEDDTEAVLKALKEARKWDKGSPVIVISDRVLCNCSPKYMEKTIKHFLENSENHLLYLNRYYDVCQMMDFHSQVEKNLSLHKTYSPCGVDAIVYTPYGRDIILGYREMINDKRFKLEYCLSHQLNEDISSGNIEALCTEPQLFHYDVSNEVWHHSQYRKSCSCAPIELATPTSESFTTGSLVALIITILIVFIVAWALFNAGPHGR